MSAQEATEDFRELVSKFRTYYGPKAYKEKRFNFNFETWAKEIEAKVALATTDAEIFGLYAQFISRFKDGHVGIRFLANSSGQEGYSIPVFVTPVAGKFLVAHVGEKLATTKIEKGDEILKVDGQTPNDILRTILKYSALATDDSELHLVFKMFDRPFYMSELRPTKNTARVEFAKPDGTRMSEDLVWTVKSQVTDRLVLDGLSLTAPLLEEMRSSAAGNTIMSMAHPKPFFLTEQVQDAYKFRQVTANDEFRKKFSLAETDKPNIHAYLYKFEGKTILLVRSFIYSHSDFPNLTYLRAYKAIMDQWQDVADVLVLDQTHNGGGSYCEEFFRLFINEQKDGFVQALNVDRKWITDLRSEQWGKDISKDLGLPENTRAFQAMGSVVEVAYDRGDKLTEPLPIIGGNKKVSPADFTWKKPMLVLVDELAGSCADAFPMLIKNNQVAKIFGKRTMGLGGNVEAFDLTHSRTQIRLTRGLFTNNRDDNNYTDERMIENNGVTPDYSYEHTVDDFRAGFVEYVKAFSKKAVEQIK